MTRIAVILLALMTSAFAQSAPQTEEDILGDVIAQQTKTNARLIVQLKAMQQAQQRMQAEIAREKARADAAEAKLPKVDAQQP